VPCHDSLTHASPGGGAAWRDMKILSIVSGASDQKDSYVDAGGHRYAARFNALNGRFESMLLKKSGGIHDDSSQLWSGAQRSRDRGHIYNMPR
jgi:hypothetical protein